MKHGIHVSFDNPDKTALRWDFAYHWTWDDFYASLQTGLGMRATVKEIPCVPIILNFKDSGPIPMGVLPHARAALEMMDPRDYLIVANGSGFTRSLVEVVRTLNPTAREKMMLVDTLEDARLMIVERNQG